MSKKNELPVLAASLLLTIALLGGAGWWLKNRFSGPDSPIGLPGQVQPSGNAQGVIAGADGTSGRSMLPGVTSPTKQKGLDALAAGDYATAQAQFTAALEEQRNDPESLIYLNNAKIGGGSSYAIALSVPAGRSVNQALELIRGAAQAQQDINEAGGINGTPLKVLLLDDKDDKELAAQNAANLVSNSDVLAVVGHYASGTTLAAAEVYESGQLPMISPTSTAVELSNAGDYIFRAVPSDRLAAATLARYVINDLQKTQAAVFYTSESTYSNSVKLQFTTELLSNGGQVVADFDIDEPGFSAGRAVQQAKEAGAELIMLALTAETADTSLQIISVNQRELPMVGGDDLYDPKILDVGRSNAEGLTVAVPWHILRYQQSPFVAESRRLWGGDVNWRTVMAYDAVATLVAAMQSLEPSREGIQAALSDPGFTAQGATNSVSFLPTGDRNQPSQLVTIEPGSRSGTGFDYVPVQ